MDLLLEFCLAKSFLLDALGVIGLGLLGLAAVRLSQRYRSWGGSLLAIGALLLLLGRLAVLALPHAAAAAAPGSLAVEILSLAPVLLLTAGLAGVVWGLWGHEQWLRADR